jgi:hypothetical protein
MKATLRGLVCLAAIALGSASIANALPQADQQAKCINKVNKAASKVQAAQGKANAACVKEFVKGSISGPNAADNCVLDDPKDKVEGKQQNVLNDESKNCLTGELPDFGYTSGVTAGTVAKQVEVDLIHDVFGNPVDSGLFICDTNPDECLCQRQAVDRVEKLFRAMSKLWVKCKKAALAIGKDPFPAGAADISELQQCVTNGSISLSVEADTKGKLAAGELQLSDTIGQFCTAGGNEEFPGVCAGQSGAALASCLRDQTECRFCKMVNGVDAATIDCAAWSGSASCAP